MPVAVGDPVEYALAVGETSLPLRGDGQIRIELRYTGRILCLGCGKKTKKSFHQGYCFRCFQTRPECDPCTLRPDQCRAHEGFWRDQSWAQGHCLTEHIVYLAQSSGIKVGVTRRSQVPTRWIDQGASLAIELAQTPNRYIAGCIETALTEHFADKTDWRAMLRGVAPEPEALLAARQRAVEIMPAGFVEYVRPQAEVQLVSLRYPVTTAPSKPKSITFDKETEFAGQLSGIKGQYLILDDMRVFNVRRHGGYEVEAAIEQIAANRSPAQKPKRGK